MAGEGGGVHNRHYRIILSLPMNEMVWDALV